MTTDELVEKIKQLEAENDRLQAEVNFRSGFSQIQRLEHEDIALARDSEDWQKAMKCLYGLWQLVDKGCILVQLPNKQQKQVIRWTMDRLLGPDTVEFEELC